MIEGSIRKVDAGTKIATVTADGLTKIVKEVSETARFIDYIAKVSNDQSIAIDQISQGLIQVSSVVQSNAATSEETAATSEELSSQADVLKEKVSIFKIRRTSTMPETIKSAKADTKKPSAKSVSTVKQVISLNDGTFGKY